MTIEQARKKAKNMAKQNSVRIYFVMGKNNDFEVFVGWGGRDEAIKNGFKFPKYSMSRKQWVMDCDYNYYREDWCN